MLRSNRLRLENNTHTLASPCGVLISAGFSHRVAVSEGQ